MGCQMNVYDSDYMAQELVKKGFEPVETPEAADIILVNTCTVREKPAQKAFSSLGRMSEIKKQKKTPVILGVTGCLAQEKPEELKRRFPALDLIAGPREVARISTLLERLKAGSRCIVATDPSGPPPQAPVDGSYFRGRSAGYVSIMEGCNNFCTYCIVPYVRGRELSRSPGDILHEVRNLTEAGVKDITLLGQNVNSYHWVDAGRTLNFPDLLQEVSKVSGMSRLRFTTSHPKDLSDALLDCFASLQVLAPHIHLPFQAGSNRVLRKMGRGYSREHYMSLIHALRTAQPDIAITSDVMVGFPGESDEDFLETMDLVGRVRFDGLFSFKYSDRDGTPAARMKTKIPEEIKSRRLAELQDLQKEITRSINQSLAGREVEVLVEGSGKRPDQCSGRTGTNKIVNFTAHGVEAGDLVRVVIRRGYLNSLLGELI